MNTTSTPDIICARIAERVAESIGQRRFDMFFARSAKLEYNEQSNLLKVSVPNQFVADRISRSFTKQITQAAASEIGNPIELNLRVMPALFDSPPSSQETKVTQTPLANLPKDKPSTTRKASSLRHHLDDFVVGSCNELAYTAACAIADDESHSSNTLFVYGGCGLGKTHLLQGVCRRLLNQHHRARVKYLTGEQFTNEFLMALRSNRVEAFRRKIRKLDLLAIDDVDFIANKKSTQEEFLHSFDALDLKGSRVVLACDNHPKLVKQFSEALISRCARGMVAEVKMPDIQMRDRIIHELAKRRGLALSDASRQYLAARCIGSIRDIEGSLTQLHALTHLSRKNTNASDAVSVSTIRQLFEVTAETQRRRVIRFDIILKAVIQELGLSKEQILSNSRHRDIVLARSSTAYLTRQLTSMSFPEISAAMKRSSHSTIITATQRIEKQIESNHWITLPNATEKMPLSELIEKLKQAIYRA